MATTLATPHTAAQSITGFREITHWIDGRRVSGTSGRRSDVFNPATGHVQATVALANRADLDAAVASSKRAWPDWAAQPLRRARVLFRFRELVEARLDQVAALIT